MMMIAKYQFGANDKKLPPHHDAAVNLAESTPTLSQPHPVFTMMNSNTRLLISEGDLDLSPATDIPASGDGCRCCSDSHRRRGIPLSETWQCPNTLD